jgi:hypothetical protein
MGLLILQDGVPQLSLAAIVDVIRYADPVSGSDSNDGTTPGTAFKTIDKLTSVLGRYHCHFQRMEGVLMSGTFAPLTQSLSTITFSSPNGASASCPTFRSYDPSIDPSGYSSCWTQVAGPFTVASKVNNDNAAVITTSGSAVTTNQYRGMRVLGVSGTMTGYENMIKKHTSGTTPVWSWAGEANVVAPGDVFILQAPAVVVPCQAIRFVGETGLINGAIRFDCTGSGISTEGNWFLAGCQINGQTSAYPLVYSSIGALYVGFAPYTFQTPAFTYATSMGQGLSRSTFISGAAVVNFPGTNFVGTAIVHDGAADRSNGTTFGFFNYGGYMKLISVDCDNGSSIVNNGLMEVWGHHAVHTEVRNFIADGRTSFGAITNIGAGAMMNVVTHFEATLLGSNTDVFHCRSDARALLNGVYNDVTGSAIWPNSTPGSGGYVLNVSKCGSATFVTGAIAGGASGSQTCVAGVGHNYTDFQTANDGLIYSQLTKIQMVSASQY